MPSEHQTYQARVYGLKAREREILRLVVKSFINTAGPVGSRFLSRHFPIGLSPASIRNTMSVLEERGYLDHPYTSAGRVPTELGYRAFVDELMEASQLSEEERTHLGGQLDVQWEDTDQLLREGSRLLGQLTNLLGVVLSPRLSTGVLERLEVVPLSSSRVMFVLSVRGGLIRTIVLHLDSELGREDLTRVVSMLNERLAGLTLEEIRQTCVPRMQDLRDDATGIIQLVLSASGLLFSEPAVGHRVQVAGTPNIIAQPEFQEPDDLRSLIALLEDQDTVVHLLEEPPLVNEPEVGRAYVRIGSENENPHVGREQAQRFSIVTAQYARGGTRGTIGVIGPTRMDYERVVALVEGIAALISWPREDAPN